MSHFNVLCIGENVEDQLEPFWELDLYPHEAKKDKRAEFDKSYSKEDFLKTMLTHNNKYPDKFIESIEEFAEYEGYTEHNGNYGNWLNLNAQWDWYEIGGRWKDFFKVKDNPKYPKSIISGRKGYADSIKLCDIDFDGMKKESIKRAKSTWADIQKKIKLNDKTVYWIYDINKNDTKESYIEKNSNFYVYAILKDGKWKDRGELWGFSTNDKENIINNWEKDVIKLINTLPEDTLLTIVDCHI